MNGTAKEFSSRREFIRKTAISITGAAMMLPTGSLAHAKSREKEEKEKKKEKKVEEVSPPEDLMREHGVLRRILLVYEDARGRLMKGDEFPPKVLASSAEIIQRFIENYHEKLEEDFLFPRFEKAGKLVELVAVLREQHKAGRLLTAEIIKAAAGSATKQGPEERLLVGKLDAFIRMYRPHAAREDTVLFPALRSIVSGSEFDDLGEQFEDKEEDLFGKGGFEKIVEEVAALEKGIGIYELAQFTPAK